MKRSLICAVLMTAAALFAGDAGTAQQKTALFDKPLEVSWYLEELTTPKGAAEAFRKISAKDAGVRIEQSEAVLPGDAKEYRFKMTNVSKKPVFLRPVAKVRVPMEHYRYWNGYWNANHVQYDPTDNVLSTLFPAIGAYSDGKAVILGVRPTDFYSRLDPGLSDKRFLTLGFPSYLDPGESFTYSFVVAAAPGRYGYRDIVQAWYKIFPKEFRPADQLHPGVMSNETGYLFWNRSYKTMPKYTADMLRRANGGYATWEWIYAPCIRGGDWDITEELTAGYKNYKKEDVAKKIKAAYDRIDPAEEFNVAPMWYVNVVWIEEGLCLTRWPDLRFRNWMKTRSWGNDCIYGMYCFGSDYTDIFLKSLDRIPKKYPQVRGIAWDSCFGHHIVYPENRGFKATPAKSFYNREPMALEAIGICHLLDYNHKKFNGGYRMANCMNYKETTPFYMALRADIGEIEGTPMDRFDDRRVIRVEAMRARLGTDKPLIWHKNIGPRWTPWIPYAELEMEDRLDAYRQVTDDSRFLSYYWGAIQRPNQFSTGVEELWNSIPESISLVQQGWLPSPCVDAPKDILVARYGEGAGARLALINANFEEKNADFFFPRSYWNGKAPLISGERPAAKIESKITAEGTAATIKLPARSVTIIRVAGLTDASMPVFVKGAKVEQEGKPAEYRLTLSCEADACGKRGNVKFNGEFFHPYAKMPVAYRFNLTAKKFAADEPVKVVFDTADFAPNFQTERTVDGDIVLRGAAPVETHTLTGKILAEQQLLEKAREGKLAIAAAPELKKYADRTANFFNFLMQFDPKPAASPAIVAPGSAAQIELVVDPAAVKAPQIGKCVLDNGRIRLIAAKAGDMAEVVRTFLCRMDKVYPWYGTIEDDSYEGFKQTGLTGKKLPVSNAKPRNIYHPTMMEVFRSTGL